MSTFFQKYVRLEGVGGVYRSTRSEWRRVLDLAVSHGWIPQEDPELYFDDGGMEVTQSDANSLGHAIRKGIVALESGIAPDFSDMRDNLLRLEQAADFCLAGTFRVNQIQKSMRMRRVELAPAWKVRMPFAG